MWSTKDSSQPYPKLLSETKKVNKRKIEKIYIRLRFILTTELFPRVNNNYNKYRCLLLTLNINRFSYIN